MISSLFSGGWAFAESKSTFVDPQGNHMVSFSMVYNNQSQMIIHKEGIKVNGQKIPSVKVAEVGQDESISIIDQSGKIILSVPSGFKKTEWLHQKSAQPIYFTKGDSRILEGVFTINGVAIRRLVEIEGDDE